MIIEPDFSFKVPGPPRAWARAGRDARTGRTFTPWAMDKAKGDVRIIGGHAMRLAGLKMAPKKVPVLMSVDAFFKMPKSIGKKEREQRFSNGAYHTFKPDGDNIVKLIKDALNGICWHDDCQVQIMGAYKFWVPLNDHTEVKIKVLK